MSEQELAAIRVRLDATTDPLWYHTMNGWWVYQENYENILFDHKQTSPQAYANAVFYVYARDDITALLAEVERLRAQVVIDAELASVRKAQAEAEVERLRAENAALREIAQAVAAMDIVSAEARTLSGIPSGLTHADLIAKARALLADAPKESQP